MGNPTFTTDAARVRVLASPDTWIEGDALRQLHDTAALPGMREVVGMPDLHPGKGSPVGAAFLSQGLVRPSLVGSDIGCGMSLWTTGLRAAKIRLERAAEALDGLDSPWDGDTTAWLAERGLAPTPHDSSLGTVGRGNHFLELQAVHEFRDEAACAGLGIEAGRLVLLVHSGSRGLGEAILRAHTECFGAAALWDGTAELDGYMRQHDLATAWARASRDLVTHRAGQALRTDVTRVLDICHNAVVPFDQDGCRCWLHRKGAAPSDGGPVVIPGSRGDLSWLVRPVPGRTDALLSLAHGAGRKIARLEARGKLRGLHRREDLKRNPWGGRVICGDEALAWEEAPECYKPIETIIATLEAEGLIERLAAFHPIVTFKTGELARIEDRRDRDARQRERADARQAKHRGQGR
jgi:release factor H-coupled RctB family protein